MTPTQEPVSVVKLAAEHRRLSARYNAAIARHFDRYRDGSASRARTTSFNALAARYCERLAYLKSELAARGATV